MPKSFQFLQGLTGLFVLFTIGTIGLILNATQRRSTLLTGLPEDPYAARDLFDRRVRAMAKPGTPVKVVTDCLRREGFRIDPTRAVAVREDRRNHCRQVWRVVWETSGTTIAAVRPSMGVSAL